MHYSKPMTQTTNIPKRLITVLCAGATALLSTNLYADKKQPTPWDIGINTIFVQSPFVDGKGLIALSPTRLRHGKLRLQGFAWPLYRNSNLTPYIGLGFDEWDRTRGDSPLLADMDDLDLAVNIRAGIATGLSNGQLTAELGKDVAGAHKGLHAKVRYSRHIELGDSEIRPFIEGQWLSDDLTNYYVGVANNESKVNRPEYTADADFALKAGLNYRRRISESLTLISGVSFTRYGSKISDSPIIENDLIWGAGLGLTYRWK